MPGETRVAVGPRQLVRGVPRDRRRGGRAGSELTHAGKEHDAKWIREWISDPAAVDDLADMPPFNDKLTPEELTTIANYLAARK